MKTYNEDRIFIYFLNCTSSTLFRSILHSAFIHLFTKWRDRWRHDFHQFFLLSMSSSYFLLSFHLVALFYLFILSLQFLRLLLLCLHLFLHSMLSPFILWIHSISSFYLDPFFILSNSSLRLCPRRFQIISFVFVMYD